MSGNPYNFTRPVTDPAMFYGRGDVLRKIFNGLTDSNPGSYAVYGGRRSGKTSLIRMLERRLNERLDAHQQPFIVPLYMDMQFDPPSSPANFFQRLINRLVEWQSGAVGMSESLPPIRETDPAPSFAEAFIELYCRVRPKLGGVNLALLVDESENLQRPNWARGLDDNLRALLSNVPGVTGHLGLVMTGGVDFYTDMAAEKDGSPLRNVLDEEIKLTFCPPEEMLKLINEPTQFCLSKTVADGVLQQAGGHLFLAQYLMSNLWIAGLEEVNAELLQEFAESFLEKRRDFEGWQKSIGEIGSRIYSLLLQKDMSWTKSQIAKELNLSRMVVAKAVDPLIFHNIVSFQEEKLTWRGEMFKKWFADNIIPTLDLHESKESMSIRDDKGAKYVIHVDNAQGLIIGDNSEVDQDFQNRGA